MAGQSCFVLGCDRPAPYGLRLPGLRSSLPAGKRGYLWHCIDHALDAEQRRNIAIYGKKRS